MIRQWGCNSLRCKGARPRRAPACVALGGASGPPRRGWFWGFPPFMLRRSLEALRGTRATPCLGSTALDPDAGAFRTGIAPAPLGPWVLTPLRGDRDRPREVPQGRGVGAAVRRGVSGQGGVPRPS